MSGINPDSHPDHRGDDDLPQGLFVDGTLSFPERIIPTVSVETINVFFQQLNANPGLVKSHSNELLSTQPHLFHALSQLAVHMGLDSDELSSAMTVVAASYLLLKRQLEIEQTTN